MDNKIHIFTDGACSNNQAAGVNPTGIGVVLKYNQHSKEIGEYTGLGTNNTAELKAIQIGLEHVANKAIPVIVYSDSLYSINVLQGLWKAKANTQLIKSIQELMKEFKSIEFVKVKGHAGHPENEIVDKLAVQAIKDAQQNNRI